MRFTLPPTPCLLALLLCSMGSAAQAGDPLRYRLGDGNTPPALYSIQIRADEGDTTETHSGRVELRVVGTGTQGTRVNLGNPNLMRKTQAKPRADGRPMLVLPGPSRIPFGPRGLAKGHEITLDDLGNPVNERGGDPLPYALGTIASLIFEPYPEKPAEQWTRANPTAITITEIGFPFPARMISPPPPPFGVPGRRGFDADGERLNAREATKIQVQKTDKTNPGLLTLKKEYSLETLEKEGDGPRLELALVGPTVVEVKTGLPVDIKLEGTLITRKANTTVKLPLIVSLHRLNEGELKAEKDAQAKAAEAAKVAAEKLRAPLTMEERAEILKELASGEKFKLPQLLQKLEQKTPANPDTEIAAALAKVLTNGEGFAKGSAARALEKWATQDQANLLAAQLDQKDPFVTPPCMKALGRLKATQYAPRLAANLGELSLRAAAREALVLMGPDAEEAVIPMIENPDQFTRAEVCEVLGAIGTEASVPALLYRSNKDESFLVKNRAKDAMEKINKRNGPK